MKIEPQLLALIEELYEEILDMTPSDGFSSPRDIALVTAVNTKSAVLNKLQEAMRILNPKFSIRGL